MNQKQYTSLELSKWLHEKGFRGESEWHWSVPNPERAINPLDKSALIEAKTELTKSDWGDCFDKIPAYDILWDLCIKYGEGIFGDKATEAREYIIYTLSYKNDNIDVEQYIKDNSIL